MNRRKKKLAAWICTLITVFTVILGQTLVAYAGTGKITFSDPTVTVGDQVSVTMKIASSDGTALGASDVRLQYDSSALEFVSGTNANGGAGSIRVLGAMEAQGQTTFSFTLKFKTLKAGTTSIKVTSQEVYDTDSQVVSISHVGSSAVKVNAPATYSKEASLASLTISPGELTPEFSPDVTEYTATVSGDVEKITVSAPAKDSKASVSVSGSEGLQIGENTVTCKVTAEDGETVKTYTILVTRTEETQTETTEPEETLPSGGNAANVEDGNWTVAETFDETMLPEGFAVSDYTYDGKSVMAGVDSMGNILLYMTDENGAGDFFLYDPQTNILAPYVTVSMAEKQIIVLPPEEIPEDTELPDGFAECTIDIGEHTVHGWIWKDNGGETPEYCVVYGQNEDGERNFYRYDQKEMTLQRYFRDPDAAELRTRFDAVAKDYNSLLEDYKVRGIMIVALFGVCILLVIILIVMLLTRKPKEPRRVEKEPEEFIPTERRRRAAKRDEEYREPEDLEFEDLDELDDPIEEDRQDTRNTPAVKQEKSDRDDDDDFEFIDLDL